MSPEEKEKLVKILAEEESGLEANPTSVFGQGKVVGVVYALGRIRTKLTEELGVDFPKKEQQTENK